MVCGDEVPADPLTSASSHEAFDADLFFSLSVDMMCVIDSAGCFARVNSAWTEALGYSEAEFIGVPYRDFVHPDDLSDTAAADEEARTLGVDKFVNRYRHKDGHDVWLQWRAIRSRGDIYAIARDITADLAEEERLKQSEQAHRLLFEVSRQGVMYHDSQGSIVAMNAAAQEILGVSGPPDGTHPWECFDVDGAPLPVSEHPPLIALATGRPVHDRLLGVGRRVPTRWIRMDSLPIRTSAATEPDRIYTVFLDVTAEHQAEEQASAAMADLEYRSSHDLLTGLANRATLITYLDEALADAKRHGRRLALLYCDLDRFKHINDWASHLAGDAVLREAAVRIREAVGRNDFVARIGGDEFVIVAREAESPAQAQVLAERLRRAVGGHEFTYDGYGFQSTLSVGVALSRPESTSFGLLQEGDIALHQGKARGRDQWQMYQPAMYEHLQRRVAVREHVRESYDRNQIRPWLQPIVRLPGRQVVAVESLACIVRPGHKPELAAQWITEADDEGLLGLIGTRLVESSVTALRAMPQRLLLSLNVAESELARPEYADFLIDVLDRHRVDPRRILVEVTERVASTGLERVGRSLEALASHGVRIVLDRFGSDATSLRHLREYPIAGLKLDRTLVRGLAAGDAVSSAVATSLADLCSRLDLMAIAEGIESTGDEAAVAIAGWGFGQGWLYAAGPDSHSPDLSIGDAGR